MKPEQRPRLADCVIRAGAIHAMTPPYKVHRSIAIRDGWIVAIAPDAHDLDDLIDKTTQVIDDPDLTLLPGFIDTHTHLIFAARSINDVPVEKARTIDEFVDLIRKRAATTPKGQWIRTSAAWNEMNLAERRMPQAADLDRATADHPVLVKRGGHNDVLNSIGMRLAGVTRDTPTPAGGTIVRDPDGNPTGWLIDTANSLAERAFPAPSFEEQVDSICRASLDYAAHGITTVRDAYVNVDELPLLQAAWRTRKLAARLRGMIGFPYDEHSVDGVTARIDQLGVRSGFGDSWLQVWGLKFVIDGGAENGATEEPYVNRPGFTGQLLWDPDALTDVVTHAVRTDWRVGIHAWGDRAVRTTLDIYERVARSVPARRADALVLEHGGLARADQRARAIRLGVPITVQHPLLHDLAPVLIANWGRQRTADAFPLREWLAEGALLGAGSDYPVGPYDAMASVWGMVTRETRAGVLGPEHAIDLCTAVRLYTADAARLIGEAEMLGTLEPGKMADLIGFHRDPFHVPIDDLPTLRPDVTIVAGRAVHDPDARFA